MRHMGAMLLLACTENKKVWNSNPRWHILESTMMYIAIDPKQPEAAYAACVDNPCYSKWTAEDVRKWLRDGAEVRLVDDDIAMQMLKKWLKK
jgi:hypothetical protein